MAISGGGRLGRCDQLLHGVLADCLEKTVAFLASLPLGKDQGFVHQPGENVEDVTEVDSVSGTDTFCRLQRPAPGEGSQTSEQDSLAIGKETVAPVDEGS